MVSCSQGDKMNYTKTIREYCLNKKGDMFDMSYEHENHFNMVPYKTFCKILNRLEDEGIVTLYSKGLYSINSNENGVDSVISFYANDDTGMVVGYKLYNDLGISTHQELPIVIFTNAMETTTKNIGDKYRLERFDLIMFNESFRKLITCLELIENMNKIIDIDAGVFGSTIIDYLQGYIDLDLELILEHHKYQYSTLVTLEDYLTKLNIKNRVIDIAKKYCR